MQKIHRLIAPRAVATRDVATPAVAARAVAARAVAALAVAAIALTGCKADNISGNTSGPWTGNCDVIPVFVSASELSITGTCQMDRLGTLQAQIVQIVTTRATGVIDYTNVATYKATNGDELHTTSIGTATPNETGLTLAGVETAAGGTGRFKEASGTATQTGAVVFVSATSSTGSYALKGQLKY